MSTALMSIVDGTKTYGGVHALSHVSMEFPQGTITGIVGPNGAGKTTLINVLSGHIRPSEGQIFLEGRDVTKKKAHQRARAGLSRTFQNLELHPEMSIRESVMTGAYARVVTRTGSTPPLWGRSRALARRADEALEQCGVGAEPHRTPSELSYGQQKLVELARVLMAEAQMVLLDEPFAGLSLDERGRVAEVIRRLRDTGATIAVIDHDVQMIFGLVDSVTVLDFGEIVSTGSPEQVSNDPAVIEAYLGVAE